MSSAKSSTLPTLQGQRIKTRKRDEKEKHDPAAFRDSLLTGFQDILSGGGTKTGSTQPSPESEPLPPVPVDEVNGQGSPTSLVTKIRLDALSKFLDDRGSKKDTQDYRKYGEVLFDVLIAGGILGEFFKMICFASYLSLHLLLEFVSQRPVATSSTLK